MATKGDSNHNQGDKDTAEPAMPAATSTPPVGGGGSGHGIASGHNPGGTMPGGGPGAGLGSIGTGGGSTGGASTGAVKKGGQ